MSGPEHITGGLDLDKLSAQIDKLEDSSLDRLRQWIKNAKRWAGLTPDQQIKELREALMDAISGIKRLEGEKSTILKDIEQGYGTVFVMTQCDGTAQEAAEAFREKICDCSLLERIMVEGRYTVVLHYKKDDGEE